MKAMVSNENLPPMMLQGQKPSTNAGIPSKVGSVSLVQTCQGHTRTNRVRLSVYDSSFDRYAVVSQEKLLCKDCGYINLKNCTVKEASFVTKKGQVVYAFQILPRGCDGNVLTFRINTEQELRDWMDVLETVSPPSSPRRIPLGQGGRSKGRRPLSARSPSSMPVLEEEGNEE